MLKQRVYDVVRRGVIGVGPEACLADVLRLMTENSVSCVPVLDNGKPMGIVTERGLIRLLVSNGNGGDIQSVSKLNGMADKPVTEVMSTPVTTVSREARVYEALQILVGQSIRHLVVVNDNGLAVGVLTLSNLVNNLGSDLFIEFQPVDMHMSRVVYSLHEDQPLAEVLQDMVQRNISCMLYVQEGKPLGLLTERDVVRLALKSNGGPSLEELTMTQAMSSPVLTVHSGSPIHEVADLMRERKVRRVVVVDDDERIVGLATQSNIIRSLESSYIRVLREVIEEKEIRLQAASLQVDKISLYLDTILNTSIDMAIVATDKTFRIIYYNACAEKILGYHSAEALGRHVRDIHLIEGIEADRFEAVMEKTRTEGSHSFTYQRELDGQDHWFQARISAILDEDRELEGFVYMVRDITERKRAEDNVRFMAYHDILTGLPNRVSFDERLRLELAHAERNGSRLAVMLLDLDHFKEVNDTQGHYAGDLLLEEVGKRLSGSLRKSDTVARVGGDEFMMVLPSATTDEAVMAAASKMAEAMREPVEVKGKAWPVRLSLGASFYPDNAVDSRRLVELADEAMYQAKQQGRTRGGSNLCLWGASGGICTLFED